MELALAWKKLLLVGIAVAALAAYLVPSSDLMGLNAATASSVNQNIGQSNDGCSGDCTNSASNYGSSSGGDADTIDQNIEQSNEDCEGTCSNEATNNAVIS